MISVVSISSWAMNVSSGSDTMIESEGPHFGAIAESVPWWRGGKPRTLNEFRPLGGANPRLRAWAAPGPMFASADVVLNLLGASLGSI